MAGGGLGFGSGFAQGFAGALQGKRERERQSRVREEERRERQLFATLPFMLQNMDPDHPEDLEAYLQQNLAGLPKPKKGQDSPLAKFGKMLSPFFGGGRQADQPSTTGVPQSNQPPGVTGGTLDSVMARARGAQPVVPTGPPTARFDQPPATTQFPPPVEMPAGQNPFGMDVGDHITEPRFPSPTRPTGDVLQTTQSQGQPPTSTAGQQTTTAGQQPRLFNVRMQTPEQKADRAAALKLRQTIQADLATEQARDSLADRMGLTGEQRKAFKLEGKYLPLSQDAARTATLSPNELLVQADTGKEIARGLPAASTASQQINTLEEALVQAQTSGDPKKVQAVLDLQKRSAEAKREPSAAGDDTSAMAEMAANNPNVLQGLTPTLAGGVLNQIAKSPALRQRYEQVRMEPVRAQARELLDTMKQVLQVTEAVDPTTNEKTYTRTGGLTGGARSLYGGSRRIGQAYAWVNQGSAEANAQAALKQLTGQQVLDLIKTMKDQSRTGATGFGQMNLQELALLEQTATILRSGISEDLAQEKLVDLFDKLTKILQPSAQEAIDATRKPSADAGSRTGTSAKPGATGFQMDDKGNILVNGQIVIPGQ